jgi:hypothetical protein
METMGTNMFDDAAIRGFVVSMRDVTERRPLSLVPVIPASLRPRLAAG